MARVDDADPPVEHPDFADQPVMLLAAAFKDARLEPAGPVDDPRQPPRADVEEGAEPREQEHRCNRQLDDLSEVGELGRVEGEGQARPCAPICLSCTAHWRED